VRRRRRAYLERAVEHLRGELESIARVERSAAVGGVLQSLDPRVKVCGVLALVAAATFTTAPLVLATVILVAAAIGWASGITPAVLASRVWIGVLAFTGILAAPAIVLTPGDIAWRLPIFGWPVTVQGLRAAVLLVLRVETTTTLAYLLVATTPWTKLLKALRTLRVPAVVVAVLAMTARYAVLLLQAAHDMFDARRSRTAGAVAPADGRRLAAAAGGVLLSRSLALADDVHLAMQARGFRGDIKVLEDPRMHVRDWGALAALLTLAVAVAWAR